MKKILLVLLFVISVFANTNIEVPKEIGNVDGAVYTADKKTLYTLKNETVTKWNVKPLKKLDSFETTVNHLRNYVAENVDDEYLQKFIKYLHISPMELDEKHSILTVFSSSIEEEWDLKNKQLILGKPRISNHVSMIYKIRPNRNYALFVSSGHYYKPIHTLKVSMDHKKAYEIYLNPNLWWGIANSFSLSIDLKQEFFPKESSEIVLEMADGMSLTYYFKKLQRKPYHVFFQKSQIDETYEIVWKTTNHVEAMKAMFGTTKSTSFQPDKYRAENNTGGYRLLSMYNTPDFNSLLVCSSLKQDGTLYPTMIINSNVLNMSTRIHFKLSSYYLDQESHEHLNLSLIPDVNISVIGQTHDKKVYQWNVLIPGWVVEDE